MGGTALARPPLDLDPLETRLQQVWSTTRAYDLGRRPEAASSGQIQMNISVRGPSSFRQT